MVAVQQQAQHQLGGLWGNNGNNDTELARGGHEGHSVNPSGFQKPLSRGGDGGEKKRHGNGFNGPAPGSTGSLALAGQPDRCGWQLGYLGLGKAQGSPNLARTAIMG